MFGAGLVFAAVVAAAGAPFYLRAIEGDLERRVPDALADRGLTGVAASFSGQEGVLRCESPLADPEGVLDLVHGVDGVVLVELDRSCRVAGPATSIRDDAPPATDPPATDPPAGTTAEPDEPLTTEAGPDTTVAAFDTLDDLIRTSPRFSLFASLVDEAGVAELLDAADGELTVLAPDNDAFDELAADVIAELRTQPELLRTVLLHHLVDGNVGLADLAELAGDGVLVALDGAELAVGRTDGAITVGGSAVLDGDLAASNGVLHVIDRPLLPPELDLRALEGLPEFAAVLRTGGLELSGTVRTDDDRATLIAAASTDVDPANVAHEVVVDPSAMLAADDVAVIADLLGAVPTALTAGTVGFDGSGVFVRGVVVDDDARARLDAVAPDVEIELSERPQASTADVVSVAAEFAELLEEGPLAFAPATAELQPGAAASLDRLAAVAKRFAGMSVLVEGHTDTVGDPAVNQELSELRAAVVRLELVERGVPPEQLDHVGRGGDDPVVVDGVEDREASRRVELVVGVAA